MTGLPRRNDATRPREVFNILVLDPFENLTTALRRGQPFSEQALVEMEHLRNRMQAFSDALDAAIEEAGKVME